MKRRLRWLLQLVRQKHRHKWTTTHVNKWCHPTDQKCRTCGLTRWKETNDILDDGQPWLEWWRYPDGTISDKKPVFECFGLKGQR